MKCLKALLIIGLLVAAIVPAGAVLADESSKGSLPQEIQGTNATEMELVAGKIISNLERLHNITSGIIEKANVSTNSTIFEHYQKAEEYRKTAVGDYQNGYYEGAIANGILAMRHYKVILKAVKTAREELRELPGEIRRMNGYFKAAEKTIERAQKQGIDVGNAPELLNQTKEAYIQVMEDMRNKNLEKAKEDLAVARELKKQLDEKLVEIRKELAYANADRIVNAFLRRGKRAMEFAQRVIERVNSNGGNAARLQERLNAFRGVYEQVKELSDQGKYADALNIIMANRETIKEFYKALHFIKRELHRGGHGKGFRNGH
ncbi:hypothetical protein A3L09_03155 [Thermococcus profundus]|uniref:Uncharacterized protein n=2 Tax=Thermococcus profundus TaxID=49899 RepID=A0A2Z2M7F1_THEPR|nr:hypothetical protein A3L09_03155 [Thermococcus profundus]